LIAAPSSGIAEAIRHVQRATTMPAREPGWVLKESFVADRTIERVIGLLPHRGSIGYAVESDAASQRETVRAYAAVDVGKPFPGVNVRLKASARNVEKVFTIEPHYDAAAIRMRIDGTSALRVTGDGALEADTALGPIRFTAPQAFQTVDGISKNVEARYVVHSGTHEYGFALGTYDPRLPVTIDPLLQSTFVGGAGDETVAAMAIHPGNGEVYIAGFTDSASMPATAGAEQTVNAGATGTTDTYVTRLDPTLTTRLQTTFFGGAGADIVTALAIHPATFDVYVAGYTSSPTLPATAGAPQPTNSGNGDGFVVRLNAALTQRLRTTFFGDDFGDDRIMALAIHPVSGEVIVAAWTTSAELPATAGAEQMFSNGLTDGFIARLDSTLAQRLRTTFFGGSDHDFISAIGVHPTTGEIYATGYSQSTNLPAAARGAQPTLGGALNPFVTRLDADLSHRLQTTYLGGSTADLAFAIAFHPVSGEVYVTGWVQSPNFPGTGGSQQPQLGSGYDMFLTRLDAGLTHLLQSTYIGGGGEERPLGIAFHTATGEVFVGGYTNSADYPATAGGLQMLSSVDAVVTRLNRELTRRVQSTYLGGPGGEQIVSIAIHPVNGDVYVAGNTNSPTFPGTAGAEQTTNASTGLSISDAFVSRLTRDLTGVDTTPAPFAFAAQGNVPTSTLRTSGPVQLAGLAGLAPIYVEGKTGSEFCISSTNGCSCNVVPFQSAQGTVADSQYVCVRHVSSPAPNDVTRTTLHVGGEAASFFVSTGGALGPPCSLDVDGDGEQHALTDGLLLMRALFGLTGTAVTTNAVAETGTRKTWDQIRPYLNGNCGASFAP
jgi:hypothetical protein